MTIAKSMRRLPGAAMILLAGALMLPAQNAGDALRQGFQNPPNGARPRVWWHWMNGNITKEGITADLEWMHRTGIGGFQNFDAAMNSPKIVDQRLIYMTPGWKDAFKHTVTLADKLGLEMAIAGSPGWSESGGPWVTPAQAMKKFVWSETWVEGGKPFTGKLAHPPTTVGAYQNMAGRGGFSLSAEGTKGPEPFYAESAVVALRAPDKAKSMAQLAPKVTSSGGEFTLAGLTDGDVAKATLLPAAPLNEKAWLQYEFPEPVTVHGLTLVTAGMARGFNPFGGATTAYALEASDDGREFRVVAQIPAGARNLALPPVTARIFRFTSKTLPAPPRPNLPEGLGIRMPPPQPAGTQITEFVLHTLGWVNRVDDKAGFSSAIGLYAQATPAVAAADVVKKGDVVDLTSKMQADGTLNWTPPAGEWVVLRMGYSLIGTNNHPASPEATGLEVDKLSGPAVKAYFENYLDQYKDATGGLMGKKGLQYVITDSWEAGQMNWTEDLMAQFAKRRGYDMRPWLPVLVGYVVESAEASDQFLWDFRKTLGELTVENHYDQLTTLLASRGMGRYTESHESGRALVADGMDVKKNAAVPMSAMWVGSMGRVNLDAAGINPGYAADIRESASVAHIYGQNVVAAESLTAGSGAWTWSPETLKPTADAELSQGLNRFVIHTSVHQPVNDKIPGLSLGPFGQWFTRHETWAEQAKPWISYLARSSYLLQQGHFVADVLYYYGEDSNVTALFGQKAPALPAGYNFDYASSDVILNRVAVADGKLTTKTGMSYRVLVLDPNASHMPLAVLKKLHELVAAGAVVAGPKPTGSPSLADDQAEFKKIADELWGGKPVGKGKVYDSTVADVMVALKTPMDFDYTKPQADTMLLFVHRALSDGDLYWVNNRRARAETVEATFRVSGKEPEIWHADTGVVEPASYRTIDGRTAVTLKLDANDAVFVVFRKAAKAASRTVPTRTESTLGAIDGTWDVAFQPNRGAPAKITLDKLASFSDNADAGVKYFSGTAAYTTKFNAPAAWFKKGAELWLDLGNVKNIAEVSVNGKTLGEVWKAPFRVNVTGALKAGANTIEVKVTNLWVNRLVGDQQPGTEKKYTWTSQQFYRANSPLLPSGLLGPVQVVRAE